MPASPAGKVQAAVVQLDRGVSWEAAQALRREAQARMEAAAGEGRCCHQHLTGYYVGESSCAARGGAVGESAVWRGRSCSSRCVRCRPPGSWNVRALGNPWPTLSQPSRRPARQAAA